MPNRGRGTGVLLKKKILVVDDNAINRGILYNLLQDEYEVLQAEDGQKALKLLGEHGEEISIVLLDIVMPVIDGYEFLRIVKADEFLSSIPVIVTTSNANAEEEIRCLASGAADFVTKPYNPEIVKHRVAGIIRLRETSAMLNMLEFDPVTGLYSKEFFYQHVAKILKQYPEKQFDIVCSNVENFRLVNERYGTQKGDEVLRFIADSYMTKISKEYVCSRIGADIFAILLEHNEAYSDEMFNVVLKSCQHKAPIPNLVVKFGAYENVDRSLPVSGMCDRAVLALRRTKNQYGKTLAIYDDSLHRELLREQRIQEMMEEGLTEKQFQVYYQPKHHIQKDRVAGAEALVRWIHPVYGFMSPGEFIPIFEKNGFITKLDFYVWEQVCQTLQQWKEKGFPLLPVSVNISRLDFNRPALADEIQALTSRYGIEHHLLHLEVTESAYAENPHQIIEVVNTLRLAGFKIEMDDFGSGYSSLNMLSELSVDILKLDMKFMWKQKEPNKESVLRFIISLSRWLELETVSEGVETEQQVEALKNMGCTYVQGYFYAKPMPREDFEAYVVHALAQMPKVPNIQESTREDAVFAHPEAKETVLIVEDVELNRNILHLLLAPYYHTVETANGQEAYEYLSAHSESIAVILLDLMMPVMDGFQFMDTMLKNPDLCQIPVIVTSEDSTNSELRALRLGAHSFVGKPYQPEILLHHVKSAVDSFHLRKLNDQLQRRQKVLTRHAYRDPLTGLFNRKGMDEAISSIAEGEICAVYMLDVDDLKQCNDTYGHSYGDKLLKIIAESLRRDTREGDILARFGGDEFIIVMKGLSDPDVALKKGNQLCENIKAHIFAGYHIQPSCSIGVSILRDPNSFREVLKQADAALYQAKNDNKGQCRLWEE